MKQHFYYADLDMHVEIEDGMSGVFKSMIAVERHALQLQIHQAINGFLITRALYLTKPDILKKYKDCAIHNCKCTCHGG